MDKVGGTGAGTEIVSPACFSVGFDAADVIAGSNSDGCIFSSSFGPLLVIPGNGGVGIDDEDMK